MSDAVFNSLLTQTASISRKSLGAVNDLGIPAETLAVITASEPCLIQDKYDSFNIETKGLREKHRYLAFFKITANIQENDILEISSKKYLVTNVDNAGGQDHHYECLIINFEN